MRATPGAGAAPVASRPTRPPPLQHQQREMSRSGSSRSSSSYAEETSSYDTEESSETLYTPSHEPIFLRMPLGPTLSGCINSARGRGWDRDRCSLVSTGFMENGPPSIAELGMGGGGDSSSSRAMKTRWTCPVNAHGGDTNSSLNEYSLIGANVLNCIPATGHHLHFQQQQQHGALMMNAFSQAATNVARGVPPKRGSARPTAGPAGKLPHPFKTMPEKTPEPLEVARRYKSSSGKLAQAREDDASSSSRSDKKGTAESSGRPRRTRTDTLPPSLDTWDPILPEMGEGIFNMDISGVDDESAFTKPVPMEAHISGASHTVLQPNSNAEVKSHVARCGGPAHSKGGNHAPEWKPSLPPTTATTATTKIKEIAGGGGGGGGGPAAIPLSVVQPPSKLSPPPPPPPPSSAVLRSEGSPARGISGDGTIDNRATANVEAKRRAVSLRKQVEEAAAARCKMRAATLPQKKETPGDTPPSAISTAPGGNAPASSAAAATTVAGKEETKLETATAKGETRTTTTTTTRTKTKTAADEDDAGAGATKAAPSPSSKPAEGVVDGPPVIRDNPQVPMTKLAVPLAISLHVVKSSAPPLQVAGAVGLVCDSKRGVLPPSQCRPENPQAPLLSKAAAAAAAASRGAEETKTASPARANLRIENLGKMQNRLKQQIEADRNFGDQKVKAVSLVKDEGLQRRRVQRCESTERAGILNVIVDEQQSLNVRVSTKDDGVGSVIRSVARSGSHRTSVERQKSSSPPLGPSGSGKVFGGGGGGGGGAGSPNSSQMMHLKAVEAIAKPSNATTSTNANTSSDTNMTDAVALANTNSSLMSDHHNQLRRRRQQRPLHGRRRHHQQLMDLAPSHSRPRLRSLVTSQVIPECVEDMSSLPLRRTPRSRKQPKGDKSIDPTGAAPTPEASSGRRRIVERDHVNSTTISPTAVASRTQKLHGITQAGRSPPKPCDKTRQSLRTQSPLRPCERDMCLRSSAKSALVSRPHHTSLEVSQPNGDSGGGGGGVGTGLLPSLTSGLQRSDATASGWMHQAGVQ